ncbi:MAG: deoxyribonuclease IV [Fimbriiglobus sp.]
MPLFGAHFSVAGGLYKAAQTCQEYSAETFQLFTKNASQWAAKPLTDEDVRLFKAHVKAAKAKFVTAHDSYLINLAAQDDVLFQKSVDAFVVELERAEALGLAYLVTHPGAHVGSGEEAGLERVIKGLDLALARSSGYKVRVLIETTAGQGTTLGYKFEHLATILEGVAEPDRVAVCLDTCHVFAAGYDLRTELAFQTTLDEFDDIVGLKQIHVIHVNDSVKDLGCRVDRHAGLGQGKIGKAAFQMLVNEPRFAKLPMILETPKDGPDGEAMDPIHLQMLRDFMTAG